MSNDSTAELDRPWWKGPFSVFQTNLQEIDATMDVDAALDVIQAHGADTWLLNAGGIVAFHPTDLSFQTRNPHLADRPSGDMFGDAVAAATRRGVRVIARLDLSKVSARIAAEHPEWLFVDADGAFQEYHGLSSACPSGEYYQRCSFEIIDEIAGRYDVAGFFVNWFNFNEFDYSRQYHGACHCSSCRQGFARFSDGRSVPSGAAEADLRLQWGQYTGLTLLDLAGRLSAHVSERRPGAALALRNGAPISYQEASNAFGAEVWHFATAESVGAHVVARPDVPALVNAVSFVDMPYRMAAEQPERFAHYHVQTMSRGGHPSTYIMGAPGRIPYSNLPMSAEVTRFYRAHADLYDAIRPGAPIALVRPSPLSSGPTHYRDALEEYRGVLSALAERHRPFDVVPADAVVDMCEHGLLDRFALMVLPDLGAVGGTFAAAVDAMVARGLHVVATGGTGVDADGRVEFASGPALRRRGVPVSGPALWSTFATPVAQPRAGEHVYDAPIAPVFGEMHGYEWAPDAVPSGSVLPQAPYGPPERCYGHVVGPDPMWATRTCGAGSFALIPWTIGRTYREIGTTVVRDRLVDVVDSLLPPSLSTDLPEQVEVVMSRGDGIVALHLVNMSGARHRSLGPHIPITCASITLHGLPRPSAARALVAGVDIGVEEHGDDIVLRLPTLEMFEVVCLESPS